MSLLVSVAAVAILFFGGKRYIEKRELFFGDRLLYMGFFFLAGIVFSIAYSSAKGYL